MEQKRLYRFDLNYGRSGDLVGVFSASPEEISNAMGKFADFGEALGKHSEVTADLEVSMFTILSDDQEKIKWFDEIVGNIGHNPLDYIYDEEEE